MSAEINGNSFLTNLLEKNRDKQNVARIARQIHSETAQLKYDCLVLDAEIKELEEENESFSRIRGIDNVSV